MKIFFDLGGTIMIDKKKFWKETIERVCSKLLGKKVKIDFHVGDKTMKGIIKELVKDESLVEKAIEEICEHYCKNVRRDFMELKKGVDDFIKKLHDKGFELYLITGDLRRIALKRLSLFGLDKYFKDGVFGEETYFKADLIKIAKERFDTGIYFEDRPENIRAAKNLGFLVVGVETKVPGEELLKAGADAVIKDYRLFLNLL